MGGEFQLDQRLHLAIDAEAAAIFAGAAGIGHELVALDEERIFRLEQLDRRCYAYRRR